MARQMISFVVESGRFNFRVAAVALREDHILVCRADDDDYTFLPGGRVELHESSLEALQRELVEELGVEGRIERLLYLAENFFDHEGRRMHELGLYYRVDLPRSFPFLVGEPCHLVEEDGHELSFEWIAVNPAALAACKLLPKWLGERLMGPTEETQHIVVHES